MKNILIVSIVLFLIGCVSFNENDSRYYKTAIDDNVIALNVNDALFKKDAGYFVDINVTVFGGRVMLVGSVENKAAHDDVIAKASKIEGVKEIIDYIGFEGKEEGKVGFSWVIHKAIVAKLLTDEKIPSNNFKVVVYRKIAYVIGEASSSTEKARVLEIIKGTDGILNVWDSIIVK